MGVTTVANRIDGDQYPAERNGGSAMVAVARSRAAQEVQAMILAAKHDPRDEHSAIAKITRSCQRKSLAEQAFYEYPRGQERVSGPSIRLAEAVALCWGNLDFGVTEIERRHGESTMMAFCTDLETNTRSSQTWTVRHERHTRSGVRPLSDPRDIYEMTANEGSRRLRACILRIIPGDVIELAEEECKRTLIGKNQEPLQDRVRKAVVLFQEIGVTAEMLGGRLGHPLDSVSEIELLTLRKIYTSIKDGFGSIDEHFNRPGSEQDVAKTESLAKRLAAAKPVETTNKPPAPKAAKPAENFISSDEADRLGKACKDAGRPVEDLLSHFGAKGLRFLTVDQLAIAWKLIEPIGDAPGETSKTGS